MEHTVTRVQVITVAARLRDILRAHHGWDADAYIPPADKLTGLFCFAWTFNEDGSQEHVIHVKEPSGGSPEQEINDFSCWARGDTPEQAWTNLLAEFDKAELACGVKSHGMR